MTRRVVGITILVIAAGLALSQTPAVNVPITVSDGVTTATLYFGLDPTATDTLDVSLGEFEQPPRPPGGFDARFIGADLGIDLGEGSLKDYRQGSGATVGARVHEISYHVDEGGTITITWNLPDTISGRLQDLYTGALIDVPMRGSGSYVVTDPSAYSKLKMTVSYNLLKTAVKSYLQGPYNGSTGSMNKTLKTEGYLAAQFTGRRIPAEAVDSINIEIRDALAASEATIREFVPAWLLTDGTVRGFADTTASFIEFEVGAGDYYIVVRHRNHLAIISSIAVALGTESVLYDFTTARSKAHGTNPMQDLGSGVFGLWAGDANDDGQITTSDFNPWLANSRAALTGYHVTDFNCDGQNTTSDFNPWLANARIAPTSQVP